MSTFTITRTFNAPKDLMWDCWTKAEHFGNWFSPAGCTTEVIHSEVKPGGYNYIRITTADGTALYGKYTFQAVDPKDRLVYINAFADENANQIHHPMAPDWPLELLTTVEFKEAGNQTELTLTWVPKNASEKEIATFTANLESCRDGWTGTFDNLDGYLETIA